MIPPPELCADFPSPSVPLLQGSLDKDAEDVGTGLVGAPACGDVMKLQIKVDDANVEHFFSTISAEGGISCS